MMNEKGNQVAIRVRRCRRWVWYAVTAVLLINWCSLAGGMIFYPRSLQSAAQRYEAMQEEVKQAASSVQEKIKPLQEKNLFVPKPPKPTAPQCSQILGDAAFFQDKWVKVGEEINGAKVVAIDSTSVTLLWEEKEVKQYPFQQQPPGGGPEGRNGRRDRMDSGRQPSSGPSPEGSRPMGDFSGRPAWMMSPDERDQMRQRFMNMSPEEREAFRNEMRQRMQEGGFSGRRGGGRSGRGSGGD